MERVEKSIDVECPVRAVYNQWTQFEEFPRFMETVQHIEQVDDTHLHWHAAIWGKDEEWDAEIVEQKPDQRISWRSVSGAKNAGIVEFDRAGPSLTRVHLALAYEPEDMTEKIGDALGILGRQVQKTLEDFKQFMEKRGSETGAWRGEVEAGQPKTRSKKRSARSSPGQS